MNSEAYPTEPNFSRHRIWGPREGQPPTHRAYSNGRRARGQCEPVIYWENPHTGDLMLAPHTDLHPFPGYIRISAETPRDIEHWSRKLRAYEETKMRGLYISEHLRAFKKWEEQEARLRLKRAAGYKSENDKIVCERILASIERRKQTLYKLLFSSQEMLSGSLRIEQKENARGMAQYNRKSTSLER